MATTVLIEAKAFGDKGGWVIDQQFMDETGAPFLLAHGLGTPVEDAVTTVTFPEIGTYRVWVRTRDWVAPWKGDDVPEAKRAEGCPGKFELRVNGKPLDTVFGTEGADWHWQDGGNVEIAAEEVRVALHDLTGFEGRCDAICFSRDPDFTPPNDVVELDRFRRDLRGFPEEPRDVGRHDLVVVGGGIAGICAAVAAARNGLKVAFVHDRPVLGGNNSSEVRVWLNGATNGDKYPRIGDVVQELEQKEQAHAGEDNVAEIYEDDKKDTVVRNESNISFYPSHSGNRVQMEAGRITAVIAENIETGERLRLGGRWFVDCTGDGCIGALAGADFDITSKGHMGRSNLWNTRGAGKPVAFPRCSWALDLAARPFPGRDGNLESLGVWYWESGFDHDPVRKREYIRDWNFRAMYGAWDAIKNVEAIHPNRALNWAAYVSGPRESRRLLGPVILTDKDVIEERAFEDACIVTGWSIDLHFPREPYDEGFEGDAFISYADHHGGKRTYWAPYRMLYSRNVPNLFMAGRDVSVTHEALGIVRVMRTCGLMGEVIGLAASLCKQHDADPNGIYEQYLDEFKELLLRGVNVG